MAHNVQVSTSALSEMAVCESWTSVQVRRAAISARDVIGNLSRHHQFAGMTFPTIDHMIGVDKSNPLKFPLFKLHAPPL